MKTILILTNSKDGPHTDAVMTELERRKVKVFRFDVDKITKKKACVHLSINHENWKFIVELDKKILRSNEIKSVWNRRPYENWEFDIKDRSQEEYARKELRSFLSSTWYSLDENIKWVNHPLIEERASRKMLQLKIAKELGMKIPTTLVTNDPEEVKSFYKQHKGNIVYKSLGQGRVDYGKKGYLIKTNQVEKRHLKHLKLIRRTPSLFQELIQKKHELRITVVGNKIFPVKIYSQEHKETKVDFRNVDKILDLKYEATSLPPNIEKFCFDMMRKFDLKYGAFDFAIDTKNEHVFFEVNTAGQWYWLEKATGLLITKAIVDILI